MLCCRTLCQEGDGVPEIIATHFFAGMPMMQSSNFSYDSQLVLYGAPKGENWAVVDFYDPTAPMPRVKALVTDQGMIFDCSFADLNHDGLMDILLTNHAEETSEIPGRVIALEQPTSGKLFEDDWTRHILMDDIRPAPYPFPEEGPGRMAPGSAVAFYPSASANLPWIAVSGDEAAKAWVLEPTGETSWTYKAHVLFDINEYYGPKTTQTPLLDPFGIIISTIADIEIQYDDKGSHLYVPVFESTDIHVYRYKEEAAASDDDDDDSGLSGIVHGLRGTGPFIFLAVLVHYLASGMIS
jgi:hypothetical protein